MGFSFILVNVCREMSYTSLAFCVHCGSPDSVWNSCTFELVQGDVRKLENFLGVYYALDGVKAGCCTAYLKISIIYYASWFIHLSR